MGWGEGEKERTGDEAGGGMHAMVLRGPHDHEASRVSLSSEKTTFVGTQSINNANSRFGSLEYLQSPFKGLV